MKRTLGALGLAALLTIASAAQAGGYGRHYGHRHHGHHHGGGNGALVVGALFGGLVLGHLLTRPPAPRYDAYYAPAPRAYGPPPGLGGCQPTTGTAYRGGRLAQYGGTMCFDSAGYGYILNNSTYFMGYLE